MGWDVLAARAEVNLGVFDLADARECDIPRHELRRLVDDGVVVRVRQGLYTLAGVPDVPGRRELLAVRAAGPLAVVSHESAARLHGLRNVRHPPLVHLLVPRGHECRVPGAFVHSATWLPRAHRTTVGPVPTVICERAVAEMSPRIRDDRLPEVVYDGWRHGLLDLHRLAAVLAGMTRLPGRARFAAIFERADVRMLDAASVPELVGFDLLQQHGLWLPEVNHPVLCLGRRVPYFIDYAWPEITFGIEVDSSEFHSIPPDVAADRQRQEALEAAGWSMQRVPARVVLFRPDEFIALVARSLRSLGAPVTAAEAAGRPDLCPRMAR